MLLRYGLEQTVGKHAPNCDVRRLLWLTSCGLQNSGVTVLCEIEHLRQRLGELVTLLAEFRTGYEMLAGDEVRRFEFICQQMFERFVSPDSPPEDPAYVPISNLDTGDSLPRPFPPFVKALRAEVDRVSLDAHHYYQPGGFEALTTATIDFLVREGFIDPAYAGELRVLPAAGTVQIYDALCRVHIETADDTVLVPELGYGYFLSQPGRVRGRVATVECDQHGAVSLASLARALQAQNDGLWRDWRDTGGAGFDRAARRLARSSPLFSGDVLETLRDLHREFCGDREAWRSDQIDRLRNAFPESAWRAARHDIVKALRPPRVVALLHIQPSVSGYVYTASQIEEMAELLHQHKVAVFEDIAYHSICCRLDSLASFTGGAAVTYTLVGISKPMAIANLRLGLLIADKDHEEAPRRTLESTGGFVSSILQRALASALTSNEYGNYVTDNSWGPGGYGARGAIMRKLLTGCGSEPDDEVRTLVLAAAQREPALAPFADEFLARGLSRWLEPAGRPEAGFFEIVSCSPILAARQFRELGIRSSFDVFALLAYLFDLRTIPEEAMRPGPGPGTRLRLAFSPDPAFVARLFLHAFGGLTLLEAS